MSSRTSSRYAVHMGNALPHFLRVSPNNVVQACDGVALVHKDTPTSAQYAIRFSLLDAEKAPHNVYFQFVSDRDGV